MRRAVEALPIQPSLVLVDGNRLPRWPYEARAIVKGDLTEPSIGAASILAKVQRDAEMLALHETTRHTGLTGTRATPRRPIWRRLRPQASLQCTGGALGLSDACWQTPRWDSVQAWHRLFTSVFTANAPYRWLAPYPPRAQPGGGAGDARCGDYRPP